MSAWQKALGLCGGIIFPVGFPTGGGESYTVIWGFQGMVEKNFDRPGCTGKGVYSTELTHHSTGLAKNTYAAHHFLRRLRSKQEAARAKQEGSGTAAVRAAT